MRMARLPAAVRPNALIHHHVRARPRGGVTLKPVA